MQKSITVERKIYLWVTLASTASRVGEIVDNSFLFQNIAFKYGNTLLIHFVTAPLT